MNQSYHDKLINNQKKIAILVGNGLAYNERGEFNNIFAGLKNFYKFDVVGLNKKDHSLKNFFNQFRFRKKHTEKRPIDIYNRIISFYNYAKEIKPSVILVMNKPILRGWIAVIVGNILSIPVIIRFSGDKFNTFKITSLPRKCFCYIKNNLLGRIPLYKATKIITLGKYLKKQLIQHGVATQKINIIPQPIDLKKFHPTSRKEKLRDELRLPKKKKIILFVGRLTLEKGGDTLIKILKKLYGLHQKKNIFFIIVGKGKYEKKIANFGPELVKIIEEVPHNKIDKYFKAADIFIFPSKNEGLPNVILEAMACNLPIISTKAGEMKHLPINIAHSIDQYLNFILVPQKINESAYQKFLTNLKIKSIQDKYRFFLNSLLE